MIFILGVILAGVGLYFLLTHALVIGLILLVGAVLLCGGLGYARR